MIPFSTSLLLYSVIALDPGVGTFLPDYDPFGAVIEIGKGKSENASRV